MDSWLPDLTNRTVCNYMFIVCPEICGVKQENQNIGGIIETGFYHLMMDLYSLGTVILPQELMDSMCKNDCVCLKMVNVSSYS